MQSLTAVAIEMKLGGVGGDIRGGQRRREGEETEGGRSAFGLTAAPCSWERRYDLDSYSTSRFLNKPLILPCVWELDFPARGSSTEAVDRTGVLRIYKSSPESATSSSSPDRD